VVRPTVWSLCAGKRWLAHGVGVGQLQATQGTQGGLCARCVRRVGRPRAEAASYDDGRAASDGLSCQRAFESCYSTPLHTNVVLLLHLLEGIQLNAMVKGDPLPPLKPPKPTLAEGLKSLLVCMDTNFETPECAAGAQRAFVKVGLRKKSDGTYTTYNAHHKAGWFQSCVPLERAMHVC
jgi:hypothetical protein